MPTGRAISPTHVNGGENMNMVCTVCGKQAEYNEKLNVYYCREHGFTTWFKEAKEEHHLQEVNVSEEVVLG